MKKTMDKSIQAPAVRRVLLPGKRPANRAERGAQFVELAIVLPILLVFIGAAAEFGLYYNTYITLEKATRVGARYLSGKSFTPTEKTKTTHLVVCGVISEAACASGTEVVKGLTDANVVIDYTPVDPDTQIPDKITVRITGYQYQPFKFFGGSWTAVDVNASTTMVFTVEN
jgi:Flp pilus assembly protein TadG